MGYDCCTIAGAAALYWLNRLWLCQVTDGWLQTFLVCWFGDLLAGLMLPAVADLLLRAAGRTGLAGPRHTVPLLAGAGLVWECLAPLVKAGAVFDPWDFAAYQAGGALYLLLRRAASRRKL